MSVGWSSDDCKRRSFRIRKFQSGSYDQRTCTTLEGVLPVVRIDKMCVENDEIHWIKNPLIGISEEEITAEDTYQMILNPDIF